MIGHFKKRNGGVAAIVCDTTGNSPTGVLLLLSRDRKGILVGSLSSRKFRDSAGTKVPVLFGGFLL